MSCKLTYHTLAGMKAVYLENDFLKVGVLIDRGSDIFEFRYKPKDIDFLLRLPKGIRNPQTHFSQIRNTKTQFEDYYYGGWQICLPNSPAFNYRGAELGQHGEVSLIPWEIKVIEESISKLIIEFTTQPLRIPIQVTRRFTLLQNASSLVVEETVQNLSATTLDIMWGQHVAFGLPFLEEGVTIHTNAKTMETEANMPDYHRFKRGETYDWPQAKSKDGQADDSSKVPSKDAAPYSDMFYLNGYENNAFYAIQNEKKKVGFALTWDKNIFKELWVWQERNATQDFPWWGQCYAVALEPWTSKWTADPHQAINNKEWLMLKPNEVIRTSFTATAFENEFNSATI
jgi:galactose mutarotase-like enzyme